MSGSDFLTLDAAAVPHGSSLTVWLSDALRVAVADGRLPVGARLPPTRTLARDLQVSRGVVVRAYERLMEEGIAAGRGSLGTLIAAVPATAQYSPAASPSAATEATEATPLWNLSPGLPDLAGFPFAAWSRAERAALAAIGSADLGYSDPRGSLRLRTEVAAWLGRWRGIRTDPGGIVIVTGVAQALALTAQVLSSRGIDAVAVEDPGSRGSRELLQSGGITTPPVPVDERGIDVAALHSASHSAVLVTPAHQFPTGVVLSPDRRRALVEWAVNGNIIIEDDYDAEHRHNRPPVAAVKALAPDRVMYCGSVSKILAPAMRIGWALPPPHLLADIVDAKRAADLGSAVLPQLALAELIGSGGLERHLRITQTRLRDRRDALLRAIRTAAPQLQIRGVAAGLHLLAVLPDGVDDQRIVDIGLTRGVLAQSLSWHRQTPDGERGLVLGYGAEPPSRLHTAARILLEPLTRSST